jgi:Fur family transcriptional regulator, peroxide stress response regulator
MALTRREIERRMDAFLQACKREGVKVTHQRMEIFREVAGTEEHPDAETVYNRVRRRIPTVSLDTVYRALAFMEKVKLISRVHVLSERSRFDANTRPHHHFVCSKCGLIRDFQDPEIERLHVPDEVRSWGSVDSIHVEIEGTCAKCSKLEVPED